MMSMYDWRSAFERFTVIAFQRDFNERFTVRQKSRVLQQQMKLNHEHEFEYMNGNMNKIELKKTQIKSNNKQLCFSYS